MITLEPIGLSNEGKLEASNIFKRFHRFFLNMFQTFIQILQTNNSRKYFSNDLTHYLVEHGIFHQNSCPYTPQQNGVAERKNRHLLEVARAMLFTSHVPNSYWGQAVLIATYLINRLPSKTLNFHTPLSILCDIYPHTPYLSKIDSKVFRCTAYVHNSSLTQTKLDPKAQKCIFIRYSPSQKGYKCYYPTTRKFFISTDVTFYEDLPFYQSDCSQEVLIPKSQNTIFPLPHHGLPLPICSQGGASSSSAPEKTLADPSPNPPPITSKPEITVVPHCPSHSDPNNPLLVYSKRPKGHLEPQQSQPSILEAGLVGPSNEKGEDNSDNSTTREDDGLGHAYCSKEKDMLRVKVISSSYMV
ncbi:retrovirus-related Pol polyprotein from transposon TNT 1-94 isoform X1 [Diospyros lotus]|uniref:retrovirus-related Pol polyprotein from transposon TNT 1-94 isoform X1 n=1 Tax=Diospyros lotus TaxID=55363 RepID=UPI00224D2731|nr:retrovirus-related Pol polyprotein from transposon TNT 1-94 isoform X1 [Diospyros lotus]